MTNLTEFRAEMDTYFEQDSAPNAGLKLIEISNRDDQLAIDYSLLAARIDEFTADVAELGDALQQFSDKWLHWLRPIVTAAIAIAVYWGGRAAGWVYKQLKAQVEAGLTTDAAQALIEQAKQHRHALLGRAACYTARVEDVALVVAKPVQYAWSQSRTVALSAVSDD